MTESTGIYCLNTSTIRECGLGLEQEIEKVAKAGYAGIEIWVSEIEEYLAGGGTLETLSGMLSDHSLSVPNLIAFFSWAHPDIDARTEALDEARRIFEIAARLACPLVAALPAGITDRDDIGLADLAKCYAELFDVAAEFGVRPILEFWGHSTPLKTLDEAISVIEIADRPGGCLLVDVFHMAKGGSTIELLDSLRPGRVGLVHVNDYPRSDDVRQLTDEDRIYPGDGVAPILRIYDMLAQTGYKGVLSLELFNKAYQKDGADTVLNNGLQKIKNTVGPLGVSG